MTVYTLRWNGDVARQNITTVGTGSLADDNDSTGQQHFSGVSYSLAYLTGVTIPSNEMVKQVRIRVRYSTLNGTTDFFTILEDAGGAQTPGDYYTANLSGSIVTQTGAWRTSAPDGGAWTAAKVANLRARLQDNNAGGSKPYVRELYVDVQTDIAPTVTVTAPTGAQSTSRPIVTWTYSDPEGSAQERYRVRIFTAAQYSAGGFDPAGSGAMHDSGEVFSGSTSYTLPVDLLDGLSYRAYVVASDSGSGGRYSAWSPFIGFSMNIPTPAVPELTVTADATSNRMVLGLQDRQNVLGPVESSFETGTGSWVASSVNTNASIAAIAAAAYDGTQVMRMSNSATGWGYATHAPASGAWPIIAGRKYSASVFAKPDATGDRAVQLGLQWFNASGQLLSTTLGPSTPIGGNASVFQAAFVTGVAPAGATKVAVQIGNWAPPAAFTYLDAVTLVPFALNMVMNPMLEVDSNSDGLADNFTLYNWYPFAADPAPTYSLETDPANIMAGSTSQKVSWAANTGNKGVQVDNVYFVAGQQYTMSAWVKVAAPTSIGLGDGATFTVYTTGVQPGGWRRVSVTITAASSGSRPLYVWSDAQGANTLWINHIQLELGATASNMVGNRKPWVRGGLISAQRFEVQRSDDGGKTWTTLPRFWFDPAYYTPGDVDPIGGINVNDASQFIQGADYEAPRNATPLYRARSFAVIGTQRYTSQWSQWVTAPAIPATGWVLKHLTDPTMNTSLTVDWDSFTEDEPIDTGVLEPIDSDETVVIQGRNRGKRLNFGLRFLSAASFDAFAKIRRSRSTLLLQDSNGRQWYVQIVGDRKAKEWRYPDKTLVRTLDAEMDEVVP